MSLVNGGVESIAAADLRGPPPDAAAARFLIAFFDQIFVECQRLTNWGGS